MYLADLGSPVVDLLAEVEELGAKVALVQDRVLLQETAKQGHAVVERSAVRGHLAGIERPLGGHRHNGGDGTDPQTFALVPYEESLEVRCEIPPARLHQPLELA